MIGSGSQARYQMRGLKMVRDFTRLYVYGLVADEIARFVDDMEAELGVDVVVAATAESVVRESDVVVCATPAREPYLQAAVAAPRPAHHLDGLRHAGQAGALRRVLRQGRPRRLRPRVAMRA